jgi:hypothetical protein
MQGDRYLGNPFEVFHVRGDDDVHVLRSPDDSHALSARPPIRTNSTFASTSRRRSRSKAGSVNGGGRRRRIASACGSVQFPRPSSRSQGAVRPREVAVRGLLRQPLPPLRPWLPAELMPCPHRSGAKEMLIPLGGDAETYTGSRTSSNGIRQRVVFTDRFVYRAGQELRSGGGDRGWLKGARDCGRWRASSRAAG